MRLSRGLKGIGLLLFLLCCSLSLHADYCLSDSNFLRLKVLIANSLNLTDQQVSTILSSTQTTNNSQTIIDDLNNSLNSSSKTIFSQAGTILNLQNKLTQSEQTLQKQLALLTDKNNAIPFIIGGCVIGGIIIGVLVRGLF